jgi:hypothetical protein
VATMANEKGIRFDPDLIERFIEISEPAYTRVTSQDVHSLEDTVLAVINRYFQFSPTIDDLRHAFGSISRREHQADQQDGPQ